MGKTDILSVRDKQLSRELNSPAFYTKILAFSIGTAYISFSFFFQGGDLLLIYFGQTNYKVFALKNQLIIVKGSLTSHS